MPADIPHLSLPLRLAGTRLVTVEQDSLEEIAQRVETIVRYTRGIRPEEPEFGLPNLAFRELPLDADELEEAIVRWEPRAKVLIEESPERYAEAVSVVRIQVSGGGGGD